MRRAVRLAAIPGVTPPDALKAAIVQASGLLAKGGLVAMPTETVYGLAARADDGAAVARVFDAKGRPSFNPLIVHIADPAELADIAVVTPCAERLVAALWPGPLTLVLERSDSCPVHPLASAGLSSIAVRAPAHPVARALIRATGRPLVAPSANRSGRLSPTHADAVLADLGDRIDAVLDSGSAQHGLESSVVDARAHPTLLRAGAVARDALEAIVGLLAAPDGDAAAPASPGQLAAHYAPRRARLRLDAAAAEPGEAYLGFGPCLSATLNLSRTGDLVEAAAHLFGYLHALDAAGYDRIAVAPIPAHGLGEAIRDRLMRAAN